MEKLVDRLTTRYNNTEEQSGECVVSEPTPKQLSALLDTDPDWDVQNVEVKNKKNIKNNCDSFDVPSESTQWFIGVLRHVKFLCFCLVHLRRMCEFSAFWYILLFLYTDVSCISFQG